MSNIKYIRVALQETTLLIIMESAILATLAKQEFLMRAKATQAIGRQLLDKIEENGDTFTKFSMDMMVLQKSLIDDLKNYRSNSTKRERLWVSYHQHAIHGMPEVIY